MTRKEWRAQWRRWITRWVSTDLTISEYAREVGVHPEAMRQQIRRLKIQTSRRSQTSELAAASRRNRA